MAVDSQVMKVAFGPGAVRRSLRAQLARLKEGATERAGGIPTLLAEFGIPFDFYRGRAYRTGDFRAQVKALDRSFTAIEDNLLGCTIWNYCADNTNARGDQWNGEDMSIWSRDQRVDAGGLDSGGRGLRAFVRPYPRAVAGEVVRRASTWGGVSSSSPTVMIRASWLQRRSLFRACSTRMVFSWK